MATDTTLLVAAIQDQTRVLAKTQQTMAGGLAILTSLPTYTVAALPATAAIGSLAYASNGRKSGQGAGAGTGVPVWFDVSGLWFAMWSSAQVLA